MLYKKAVQVSLFQDYVEVPLVYQRVGRSLCRDGVDMPTTCIGKAFTHTNFGDLSLLRYLIMVCE